MLRSLYKFDWIGRIFVGFTLISIAAFPASLYFHRDLLSEAESLPGVALLAIFIFHVNGMEDEQGRLVVLRLFLWWLPLMIVTDALQFIYELIAEPGGFQVVFHGIVLTFFLVGFVAFIRYLMSAERQTARPKTDVTN